MRVSVIGCGNIAQVHLEILDSMEEIEISSVADIVEEKVEETLTPEQEADELLESIDY